MTACIQAEGEENSDIVMESLQLTASALKKRLRMVDDNVSFL